MTETVTLALQGRAVQLGSIPLEEWRSGSILTACLPHNAPPSPDWDRSGTVPVAGLWLKRGNDELILNVSELADLRDILNALAVKCCREKEPTP